MRRHGNSPPNTGPSIPNLLRQFQRSLRIPLVLPGDLQKRRPDQLPINRMTPHTSISLRHSQPLRRISGKPRGRPSEIKPHPNKNTRYNTPHPSHHHH